ncbi:MAG: acyl-CoA thioesterase [Peptococcaceae bacterium]|jgi:acyl-CoA hydrolase|nr:acyl-CoA thioesterase [Peptococcaceae bacterium]MDR2736665.1 acyl-CoA thioesterase [Gracilibacteraceae bacterium]
MDDRKSLTMNQVMLPFQANVSGNVHGGEIMKYMDNVAGATAIRYAKANVVTARVDELQFLRPIAVGALVTCTGKIAYVGRTSMEIIVTVDVEDMQSGRGPQRALSAFFTMVALDSTGRPIEVDPFVPESDDEKELYAMAAARREDYKKRRQ